MISALPGPILVIAPHPDDEAIGCGGTILRARQAGVRVDWAIVTAMDSADGWSAEKIARRNGIIENVASGLGVSKVHGMGFAAGRLETIPLNQIVAKTKDIVEDVKPATVLLPHPGDAHTDHLVVFNAGAAATKWFRHSSVKSVLVYETPSETDLGLLPPQFKPQLFVDVSAFLDQKLDVCRMYEDEMGEFPFPRSETAIRALAQVRGATSGFEAAEAFDIMRIRG
jgi:LmbE family N-acetylglucosaminyl deacetylase